MDEPFLTVVRGDATAAEIAALVAVLAARSRGPGRQGASRPASGSGWADRSALLRRPLRPGPDGWRASARPG